MKITRPIKLQELKGRCHGRRPILEGTTHREPVCDTISARRFLGPAGFLARERDKRRNEAQHGCIQLASVAASTHNAEICNFQMPLPVPSNIGSSNLMLCPARILARRRYSDPSEAKMIFSSG